MRSAGSAGGGVAAASGAGSAMRIACVWIGIVTMNMISSTSITSISGVVLMSTSTSGSPSGAAVGRGPATGMAQGLPPGAVGSVT